MSRRSKSYEAGPAVKKGMEQFRDEVANELGIQIPEDRDMGNLTSRQNGSIGGEMVKRMIAQYEQQNLTNR